MVMMTKKKTLGRRKIDTKKKIEKESSRQVSFSKRRTGLFKKASELCVLTGAEVAVVVRSSAGHMFAFGGPHPDAVINRYLSRMTSSHEQEPPHAAAGIPIPNQNRRHALQEFNHRHAEISRELEKEKNKTKEITGESNVGNCNNNGLFWWDEVLDNGVGLEELEEYIGALEELRKKVIMRADELTMIKSSSKLIQDDQKTN